MRNRASGNLDVKKKNESDLEIPGSMLRIAPE
jgi:hypothetical protein